MAPTTMSASIPHSIGGQLGFIIHNCSLGVKDPGPEMHLQINQYKEAWVISGDPTVYLTQPTAAQLLNSAFGKEQAYWLDATHVLIKPQYIQSGNTYSLIYSPTGGLQVTNTGVSGGAGIPLVAGGTLTSDELTRYPQLVQGLRDADGRPSPARTARSSMPPACRMPGRSTCSNTTQARSVCFSTIAASSGPTGRTMKTTLSS